MTGYVISLGYQSGYSRLLAQLHDDLWPMLRNAALAICANPVRLADEAVNFGAPEVLDGERLMDYARQYEKRGDATIIFDEEQRCIRQLASGAGASRTLKEHMRRAFIRLLMAEMHRQGIEISVLVG